MTLLFLSWLILSMGTGATARLFSGDPLDCMAPIILGSTMTVVSSKTAVITISHRCRVFILASKSVDYQLKYWLWESGRSGSITPPTFSGKQNLGNYVLDTRTIL